MKTIRTKDSNLVALAQAGILEQFILPIRWHGAELKFCGFDPFAGVVTLEQLTPFRLPESGAAEPAVSGNPFEIPPPSKDLKDSYG